MKNWRIWLLLMLGCWLAACAKGQKGNSEAAIREAIEQHLATRPGLASNQMVMDLKQVQVKGDTADADVVFRSRSDPKASMTFHYQLHKEGKSWKVETGRPNADTSPHPQSGAPSDTGSPGADGASSGPGSLPQGHPPTP